MTYARLNFAVYTVPSEASLFPSIDIWKRTIVSVNRLYNTTGQANGHKWSDTSVYNKLPSIGLESINFFECSNRNNDDTHATIVCTLEDLFLSRYIVLIGSHLSVYTMLLSQAEILIVELCIGIIWDSFWYQSEFDISLWPISTIFNDARTRYSQLFAADCKVNIFKLMVIFDRRRQCCIDAFWNFIVLSKYNFRATRWPLRNIK